MFLLTLPGLYHYCLVIKARADGWNYLGKAEEYHSRERRKLIQPYFQTALDHIYTVASFVITKQKTQPTTQTNKNNNKRKYEWLVKNLATTEKAWKLKFWWIFPFFPSACFTSYKSIRESWFTFLPCPCLKETPPEYQGKDSLNYYGIVTLFSKLELGAHWKPWRFV